MCAPGRVATSLGKRAHEWRSWPAFALLRFPGVGTAHRLAASPRRHSIDWLELLKSHPVLFGFDSAELERLLGDARERQYAAGETILAQGDFADSIFLIGDGFVDICLPTDNGQCIALATLTRPEMFGVLAAMEQGTRITTARTRSGCVVLQIAAEPFQALLHANPEQESRVLLKLSERLRLVNQRLMTHKLNDIDEKLRMRDRQIEAESRAYEATLKAAQALFDQTKIRTDEIITNADLGRSRTTWIIGTIAAIATVAGTLFGWLGVKELGDTQKTHNEVNSLKVEIEKTRDEVRKAQEEAEEARKRAMTSADEASKVRDGVEQTRTQVAVVVERSILEHVDDENPVTALNSYQAYTKLGVSQNQEEFERGILNRIEKQLQPDEPARLPDFKALLTEIANQSTSDSNRARARLLRLETMTLMDPPTPKETFDHALSDFDQSVAKLTPAERDKLLQLPTILERLNRLQKGPQERRDRQRRIREVISPRQG